MKHKMKKRLTQTEEFEIMKLVLDKFLWIGFGIMAIGLYQVGMYGTERLFSAIGFMFSGVIFLALMVIIIVKEFEVFR